MAGGSVVGSNCGGLQVGRGPRVARADFKGLRFFWVSGWGFSMGEGGLLLGRLGRMCNWAWDIG